MVVFVAFVVWLLMVVAGVVVAVSSGRRLLAAIVIGSAALCIPTLVLCNRSIDATARYWTSGCHASCGFDQTTAKLFATAFTVALVVPALIASVRFMKMLLNVETQTPRRVMRIPGGVILAFVWLGAFAGYVWLLPRVNLPWPFGGSWF